MSESLLLRIIHLGVVVGRTLAKELASHELSPAELAILLVCREHPGCTAVMIAQLVPIDTPSISRSVFRLAQRRLLARRRSREDRRLVLLRLTSEGERLVSVLLPYLDEVESTVLSALDEEQARAYRLYTEALLARNVLDLEGP